jgi:hypothetical protein
MENEKKKKKKEKRRNFLDSKERLVLGFYSRTIIGL